MTITDMLCSCPYLDPWAFLLLFFLFSPPSCCGGEWASGWLQLEPAHHGNMHKFHFVEMFLDKYENCHRTRKCTPRFQSLFLQITCWTLYVTPLLQCKHSSEKAYRQFYMTAELTMRPNYIVNYTCLCQCSRKFSLVCLTNCWVFRQFWIWTCVFLFYTIAIFCMLLLYKKYY